MKVCSSALPPFLVESTRRLLSIDVIVPRLVPVTALPCGFGKACFVAAALDCFCGFGLASPIPLTANSTPVVTGKKDFRILIFIILLVTLIGVLLQEH